MKRAQAVEVIMKQITDELVVCANGMIGRETWTYGERPGNFYMIGSMGLASSIGLGVALARPERRVAVLDGDGNILMNMGTLAQIGAAAPANLFHICLDNGQYGSTGGQPTLSNAVPLEQLAKNCGYRRVELVNDGSLEKLTRTVIELKAERGPVFLLVKVEPGNVEGIGRVALEPPELAERFAGEAQRRSE